MTTEKQTARPPCEHHNDSLYPRSVYECPNGHGRFRSYAYGGAVCWCCHVCGEPGKYVGYRCVSCDATVIARAEGVAS